MADLSRVGRGSSLNLGLLDECPVRPRMQTAGLRGDGHADHLGPVEIDFDLESPRVLQLAAANGHPLPRQVADINLSRQAGGDPPGVEQVRDAGTTVEMIGSVVDPLTAVDVRALRKDRGAHEPRRFSVRAVQPRDGHGKSADADILRRQFEDARRSREGPLDVGVRGDVGRRALRRARRVVDVPAVLSDDKPFQRSVTMKSYGPVGCTVRVARMSCRAARGLVLVGLTLAAGLLTAGAARSQALFDFAERVDDAPHSVRSAVAAGDYAASWPDEIPIRLDTTLLPSMPSWLSVPTDAGSFHIDRVHFEDRGDGNVVWTGAGTLHPEHEDTLFTVEDGYTLGRIALPGGRYVLVAGPDGAGTLTRADDAGPVHAWCGAVGTPMDPPLIRGLFGEPAPQTPAYPHVHTTHAPSTWPVSVSAASKSHTIIDIVFVYSPLALEWMEGRSGIKPEIRHLTDFANLIYRNSRTGVRVRAVGWEPTPIQQDFGADGDLVEMGVHMNSLHALRRIYDADLVHALQHNDRIRDWFGQCGVAYAYLGDRGGHRDIREFAPYAFAQTNVACEKRWPGFTAYAFAHEIGHNVGLHHSRDIGAPPESHARTAYGYGLRSLPLFAFRYQDGSISEWKTTTNPLLNHKGYVTLMSYGKSGFERGPYLSSSDVDIGLGGRRSVDGKSRRQVANTDPAFYLNGCTPDKANPKHSTFQRRCLAKWPLGDETTDASRAMRETAPETATLSEWQFRFVRAPENFLVHQLTAMDAGMVRADMTWTDRSSATSSDPDGAELGFQVGGVVRETCEPDTYDDHHPRSGAACENEVGKVVRTLPSLYLPPNTESASYTFSDPGEHVIVLAVASRGADGPSWSQTQERNGPFHVPVPDVLAMPLFDPDAGEMTFEVPQILSEMVTVTLWIREPDGTVVSDDKGWLVGSGGKRVSAQLGKKNARYTRSYQPDGKYEAWLSLKNEETKSEATGEVLAFTADAATVKANLVPAPLPVPPVPFFEGTDMRWEFDFAVHDGLVLVLERKTSDGFIRWRWHSINKADGIWFWKEPYTVDTAYQAYHAAGTEIGDRQSERVTFTADAATIAANPRPATPTAQRPPAPAAPTFSGGKMTFSFSDPSLTPVVTDESETYFDYFIFPTGEDVQVAGGSVEHGPFAWDSVSCSSDCSYWLWEHATTYDVLIQKTIYNWIRSEESVSRSDRVTFTTPPK